AWLWLYEPYGLALKYTDVRSGSERSLCSAAQPIDGNTAALGVFAGNSALPAGVRGEISSSMRAAASPGMRRVYQWPSGLGANASSAFATRAHVSCMCS